MKVLNALTTAALTLMVGCLPGSHSMWLQCTPEKKMSFSGQKYILGKLPNPDAPDEILGMGWNHYSIKRIQRPFMQYVEKTLLEASNNSSSSVVTIDILECRQAARHMWIGFEMISSESKRITTGSVYGYWEYPGHPTPEQAEKAALDAIDRLGNYLSGKLPNDEVGILNR